MLGFFASQHSKTRRLAADWLELADKVYHYRRDVLPPADLTALTGATGQLRQLLRDKADTAKLKLGIDALESILHRTGGSHYPKSGWVENVEFFLVAAIVILGLRAFYVQPFKIPTNSMWPSYFGMTGEVFASKTEEPSAAAQVFRFATVGAKARRIDAPDSGEVLLPIGGGPNGGLIAYGEVAGRSWLVIPAKLREYHLVVGDKISAPIRVPMDFDMDWVLKDMFFPGDPRTLSEIVREKVERKEIVSGQLNTTKGPRVVSFVRTGKMLRAGERMLSFDILTGDQLFVDRVSYHFVRPKVGDGFVFRTGNIPDLGKYSGDQYYIKRLVGVAGDTLKIEPPVLLRNGRPISGRAAFDANNHTTGQYRGYVNGGYDPRYPHPILTPNSEFVVPEGQYLALGDNSNNSLDGRYWGTVPAKDVIGRPLFIYYPFTRRWGPAP